MLERIQNLTDEYDGLKDRFGIGAYGPGRDFSRVGRAYMTLKDTNRQASVFNKILGRNAFPSMPFAVQLDNIGFCNLRCPQCPTHGSDVDHAKYQSGAYTMSREMTDSLAKETFPYAVKCSTSGIGEGLLHRDIDAIIRHAGHYGVSLFINSNCTTLTTRSLPMIFGVTQLQLSIDGALQETFETIRKGARYAAMLQAGRTLTLTNELLPPALRLAIGINFSICASNVSEMPFMADLADFVGAGSLSCNKMEFDVNQSFFKEEYLAEDYERYPSYFAYYRKEMAKRAGEIGLRVDCPDAVDGVEPDRDGGPVGGGVFVSARRNDESVPDFSSFVDEAKAEEDAQGLAEAAISAAIARHSELDGRAFENAVSHAKRLGDEISEGFERNFGQLSNADRSLIESAAASETEILDCYFLHKALYFMANGETRPCCVGNMRTLAGDTRVQSVKEIYQNGALAQFNADFRAGNLVEDCRTCPVKEKRKMKDIVRSFI